MTNTLGSVFNTCSTGITSVVDGWIGIGVTVMVALAAFAIASKFMPKKKKVV